MAAMIDTTELSINPRAAIIPASRMSATKSKFNSPCPRTPSTTCAGSQEQLEMIQSITVLQVVVTRCPYVYVKLR